MHAILFMVLLCGLFLAEGKKNGKVRSKVESKDTINIDDPQNGVFSVEGSADQLDQTVAVLSSGVSPDDEDFHNVEGSAMSPPIPAATSLRPGVVPLTSLATNAPPALTQCQQLRESLLAESEHLEHAYIPLCANDSHFQSKLCDETSGECWCLDEQGRRIDSTVQMLPNEPDCDTVPATREAVIPPSEIEKAIEPQTTTESVDRVELESNRDEIEPIIIEFENITGFNPIVVEDPDIVAETEPTTTMTEIPTESSTLSSVTTTLVVTHKPTKRVHEAHSTRVRTTQSTTLTTSPTIGTTSTEDHGDSELIYPDEESDIFVEIETIAPINATQLPTTVEKKEQTFLDFILQPPVLAGIVGGGIVGIMVVVLLCILCVYRMRKKDEGSYVLSSAEIKKPLNSRGYVKANDREFFA